MDGMDMCIWDGWDGCVWMVCMGGMDCRSGNASEMARATLERGENDYYDYTTLDSICAGYKFLSAFLKCMCGVWIL